MNAPRRSLSDKILARLEARGMDTVAGLVTATTASEAEVVAALTEMRATGLVDPTQRPNEWAISLAGTAKVRPGFDPRFDTNPYGRKR